MGREIVNVVGGEGADRVERQESFPQWRRRMEGHGWRGVDLTSSEPAVRGVVRVEPPLDVHPSDGGLTLAWKRVPLVTVSAWKPGRP